MATWQAKFVEYIKEHEGANCAMILREVGYQEGYKRGLTLLHTLSGRGFIEKRGDKYFIPKIDPRKVQPRTLDFKPLQMMRNAIQRPTYSGESGVVIRSRMNTTEAELLFA